MDQLLLALALSFVGGIGAHQSQRLVASVVVRRLAIRPFKSEAQLQRVRLLVTSAELFTLMASTALIFFLLSPLTQRAAVPLMMIAYGVGYGLSRFVAKEI